MYNKMCFSNITFVFVFVVIVYYGYYLYQLYQINFDFNSHNGPFCVSISYFSLLLEILVLTNNLRDE
jgi:hypothetical protein